MAHPSKERTAAKRLPSDDPTQVKFACTKCGKRMVAGMAQAGRSATCPKCGSLLIVPGEASQNARAEENAHKDWNALQDEGPLEIKLTDRHRRIRYSQQRSDDMKQRWQKDAKRGPMTLARFSAYTFGTGAVLTTVIVLALAATGGGASLSFGNGLLAWIGGSLAVGFVLWAFALPAWLLDWKGYGSGQASVALLLCIFIPVVWLIVLVVALVLPPKPDNR